MLHVRRAGRTYDVATVWALMRPGGRQWLASARSDSAFTLTEYVAGGYQRMHEITYPETMAGKRYEICAAVIGGVDLCFDHDRTRAAWTHDGGRTLSEAPVDLGHLLPSPTASLARGLYAVVGGGDGATLFPFERVVRSNDGGKTWTRFDLPRFDGERAYGTGQVVTSDGRLVTLLGVFSDDRRHHLGDRHHGLWTSAGDDWSTYQPLVPRLSPPPAPTTDGRSPIASIGASADPDPLIWVTTWDHRLYVSTDDALSFREIPAL